MKQEEEERYWSRFAQSYDRDGEYIVGSSILLAILTKLSEERELGDCLELGCGTGYFTKAVTGQAKHIIATDLSNEMLEISRAQLSQFQNVAIQKADCAGTDFPAERFDTVLMVNLIHVIDEPLPCLQESHRVLRPGGMLILVDFTGYRLDLLKRAQLGWRYLRRWGVPPRNGRNDLSPEELARLVARAGFAVKDVQLLEGGSNALYLRGLKRVRSPRL